MAGPYRQILVAFELEEASDQALIDKALQWAHGDEVAFSIVHSIEHMASFGSAYGVTAGIDVEEVLLEESVQALQRIGQQLNVPSDRQRVPIGSAKTTILSYAQEINADLIIVGSHGRHGVQLLLGSTANAILHGASCDVLAVRLTD